MMQTEDDPFLLGFGNSSGANVKLQVGTEFLKVEVEPTKPGLKKEKKETASSWFQAIRFPEKYAQVEVGNYPP